MLSILCINTYHDFTTFEVDGMVENTEKQHLKNGA